MTNVSNDGGSNSLLLGSPIMPRERIDGLLDIAVKSKLVYVIAGAGYGKTRAVQDYIQKQDDAVVRWIQLTESDNTCSRYWEHLTHNVSHDNPDLADRLREFGFPDTTARFKQFAEILKATEHRSLKTFLILDDFHLIVDKQALKFAERCAHLNIPGACVIIISRTQPDINAVSLFAKGQVSILTEDELRFTEAEISQFLSWLDVPCSAKDLPKLVGATDGWALALRLLTPALGKSPGSFEIAIDTLKRNIFKLMETEAFNDLPPDIRKNMVKLSLISELPLNLLWSHFSDTSLLREAPALAAFVWLDSFTGQCRVHPLYWEFLKSRQDSLTGDERLDTYREAAEWCCDNNLTLDAVKYLAKSRQFERMLVVLLSYPLKLPQDTCNYFLDIIANLGHSDDDELSNISYLLLKNLFVPLLLLGMGKYKEASEKCFATIGQWENSDEAASKLMLSIAYSNLSYIDMYACTVTHRYDAPKYIKKSVEYLKDSAMSPVGVTGAFAVPDIRSFATLVGDNASLDEFDRFLEMARQAADYVAVTSHNMYYGYDDLAACEIAFYKNELKEAKKHANDAILKAREKDQHSIDAMAAMYLFRIALLEGDYPLIRDLFRERYSSPDTPNFWNRKFLYELGVGFIYAHLGLPAATPLWLTADDKESVFDGSVSVRELICGAKFYMAAGAYDRALTLLCTSYPRVPHERFLFGELTLTLLTAAARARTGDIAGAIADFEKAYKLSFDGVFEIVFIELGRDLRPLVSAAISTPKCSIDAEWLKNTERKASAYSKKSTAVFDSFKRDEHIGSSLSLSPREQDILRDLYQGLSREEISASRELSINTVHKIIQSVFIKLDAKNKADAIRIAMDNRLFD